MAQFCERIDSLKINVQINCGTENHNIVANHGALLSDIIGLAHKQIDMPCSGRGLCKKCRVIATGALSPYTDDEIKAFGANLEKGMRLACVTRALGDVQITLTENNAYNTAVCDGDFVQTNFNPMYCAYGVAIDIGTTTIAAKLCHNGKTLYSASGKNPQTAFGADVISRIGQSVAGKSEQLAATVQKELNKLVNALCNDANISSSYIDAAVITGNTAMLYLLMGKNPQSLASAPFNADCLFGITINPSQINLEIAENANVYLPPCMGAFVGADVTTALLASGITDTTQTALLADIGTNGELALWHDGKLFCCSTAAGPAFEGAGIECGMHGIAGAIDHVWTENGKIKYSVIGNETAKGICGSAVIDAVAVMRAIKAIDETGAMTPEDCIYEVQTAKTFFSIHEDVGIFGKDIRAVQLAKSAVCAGLLTLIKTQSLENGDIHALKIAGGFGSFIHLKNAAEIGLIPSRLLQVTQCIGNAALSGAVMLLSNKQLIEKAETLAKKSTILNLSTSPVFMENYINCMEF